MATFLFVQGLDPVELAEDESFNKARHRGNGALKMKLDYENGNMSGEGDEKYEPLHLLSFKTAEGGRIAVQPEKFIGVGSDQAKDGGE